MVIARGSLLIYIHLEKFQCSGHSCIRSPLEQRYLPLLSASSFCTLTDHTYRRTVVLFAKHSVGNPTMAEGSFPICLLSFPLLATLKGYQSSKWNNTTGVHPTTFWQQDNDRGYTMPTWEQCCVRLPHPCGSERLSWTPLHVRTKPKCKSLVYGAEAVSWAGSGWGFLLMFSVLLP